MSFPPYPEYRDSRVEWQGAVPADWPRSALKYLADYQNGYPFKPDDWGEEGLPIIRISQLTGDAEPNYYSGNLDERVRVLDGDLLFSWSATIDSFIWGGGAAWLNQHIFKVSTSTEADQKFLFYLIKLVAPKLAEFDAHGSTMKHIKKESLSERLHVPTLPEQTKIALFLDHETAHIDALIDEQQRLIELLKEKRLAVISRAVTKGLDPTVPMKDSGVEWLGEVPAHWVIKKAGFLFEEKNRVVRACDGIVTVFRDGQVCLRSRRRESGFTLADLEHGYQGVRKGDLVLHGMDAFAGAIGVSEDDGRSTPEYVVVEPYDKSMVCEYFAHTLRVMAERNYILVLCQAVRERAPRFRYSKFSTALLPVPPSGEQEEIHKYISAFSDKCVELIAQAEQQIALLTERRAALISAAVTGKIDVRGWQPPASAQAPVLEEEAV